MHCYFCVTGSNAKTAKLNIVAFDTGRQRVENIARRSNLMGIGIAMKASTAKDCGLLQRDERGFDSLHPLQNYG
jgi:hypothetical protein